MTQPGLVPAADPDAPAYVRRVLAVVQSIPRGKVMTYGDIAEYLEDGGARQVGAVMSRHGSGVPWWRVVNASGVLPPQLRGEAAQHYAEEGTPYDNSRERVNLRTARWDGR
ncbi:MGMT family protein [Actinocrinis sp.]|uniref:MGMT family protein n=1 Tax=Actinocrinis sp. TaxID=1920516 RepID=UPI002BA7BC73|nr:MGMT family protein [Actinocrinis sp.]HXR71700.1 MGMT family protein [Actinocrinis sp.]